MIPSMLRAGLVSVVAVVTVAGVALASEPDYPLRVVILHNTGQTGDGRAVGQGEGNVRDGSQWRGFDFTYSCGMRVAVTRGSDEYFARWKTTDTRLVIRLTEIGNPKHTSECDLKVTLKDFVYVSRNGQLSTAPLRAAAAPPSQAVVTASKSDTSGDTSHRTPTTRELIGHTEVEVRSWIGVPGSVDGARWTYHSDAGPVYVYFDNGRVKDVQPKTTPLAGVKP